MSLLIKNVAIADVLEDEIKTGDIYIRNGRFEKIAEHIDAGEIEEKEHLTVINGEGLTALPGLIDAHTHVELSMLSSASFAEALIQNGTTAAVLDPHDAVNVLGHKGAKYLMEEIHVPDYKADVCTAFARGNLGKAKALAASEEFDNIKTEAVSLLKYIHDMEITDIMSAIKKINDYKIDINDYLDILSVWYRDVLLFKATNDANQLIFKDELQYIKKIANQSAYEGIEIILDALEKAKSRLRANVNFDLTMELLLLTIKEN